MQRELQRIFASIKEKTGVDIIAKSLSGVEEVSTFNDYVEFESVNELLDGEVYQKNGYTYFNFVFGGVKYQSAISGSDKISLNYAVFIKELIENSQPKEVVLTYDEQLLSIITGDCSRARINQFISKYSIKNSTCFCMLIKSEKEKSQDIYDFLGDYSFNNSDSAVCLNANTCIFVKFTESDGYDEYRSPSEYARFIVRSLYEELGINVKIYIGGYASSFAEISNSYKQAEYTENCCAEFGYKNVVCAYKDFAMLKLTEDVSNVKVQELFSALVEPSISEVLNDDELYETAENFLSNDLNVSETSRVMHIHRNTLMYRLDKIEKTTGLDIRKFNDALDFRLISILFRNYYGK